jgi:hypothetical protein
MAREDIFLVRHSSLPAIGEGQADRSVINRMGMQIVVDFYTQLALSGLTFHMQAGTEDAGVALTGAIDDTLAFILADNPAGYAMIPLLYEVNPGVLAGATIAQSMLEIDKAKARYASGGTAFVPANLNSQSSAAAAAGTFYVCAGDIVAAAKSAVPLSVELARKTYTEDALADTIGYPGAWDPCVYSVMDRPMAVISGVGSIVAQAGSPTGDMTGYGVLQFAQLTTAQVNI